jgi:hypothetical protein
MKPRDKLSSPFCPAVSAKEVTLRHRRQKSVEEANGTILTRLVTLDTPGKASVSVVILADPVIIIQIGLGSFPRQPNFASSLLVQIYKLFYKNALA